MNERGIRLVTYLLCAGKCIRNEKICRSQQLLMAHGRGCAQRCVLASKLIESGRPSIFQSVCGQGYEAFLKTSGTSTYLDFLPS